MQRMGRNDPDAYQSACMGEPSLGFMARLKVSGLMVLLMVLTLPSPRAANMAAV